RIRHHLKYNLWRPESTVLFVGYQAEGTLGRLIMDGEKTVRIFGEEIAVKADIRCIESYSAHADQAGLVGWIKGFTRAPREVFIVHGEPESSTALAGLLRRELGLNVSIPFWRQAVELQPVDAGAEDTVKSRWASLAEKVGSFMAKGPGKAERDEFLRRLGELEKFVEKAVKIATQ
ncbi:MAG TPA: MBL fold metallo-hydrolase RNA specificity domain-containing protein, partial [Bacillota bacterium]|nr:MBL fold metallo-hydrolase RNA specificity domain-containing protein [Bacillota bacterium]